MQTRREFLSTTGVIAASSTLALMNTGCIEIKDMSLQDKFVDNLTANTSYRGLVSSDTAEDSILHALKRISFGVVPENLKHAREIGLDAYIEEQLHPDMIENSQVNNYIAETYPRLLMIGSELIQPEGHKAHGELQEATIYRMINSNRQLYEVMVEFWNDHFNIAGSAGHLTRYKSIDDREVIRANALGNFRTLLHASAKSPAMIEYLNNNTNTKNGPNENYAREVMELHTLGIDGGYTEDDVKEAARCFTGWNIARSTISFQFRTSEHDYDQKQVLGNLMPAGQGVEDAEQLLDILLDNPATAKFIASKLIVRFVSDVPPPSLINRVAEVYQSSNGDIPSMLRVIFASDEFAQSANLKFKRPVEYIVSIYRTYGVDTTTFAHPKAQSVLDVLGQMPFEWPTPDGYPDIASYWNNTQGLATRWEFALTLSEVIFNPTSIYLPDWVDSVSTAESFVDQFSKRILNTNLSGSDRDNLILLVTENKFSVDTELDDVLILNIAATIAAAMFSMPLFMLR